MSCEVVPKMITLRVKRHCVEPYEDTRLAVIGLVSNIASREGAWLVWSVFAGGLTCV